MWDFFDDDCIKCLWNVLNGYFLIYMDFLEKILWDNENVERLNIYFIEGELEMIKKENSIFKMFKFEFIDKIFWIGVCDEFCGGFLVDWNLYGEIFLLNY